MSRQFTEIAWLLLCSRLWRRRQELPVDPCPNFGQESLRRRRAWAPGRCGLRSRPRGRIGGRRSMTALVTSAIAIRLNRSSLPVEGVRKVDRNPEIRYTRCCAQSRDDIQAKRWMGYVHPHCYWNPRGRFACGSPLKGSGDVPDTLRGFFRPLGQMKAGKLTTGGKRHFGVPRAFVDPIEKRTQWMGVGLGYPVRLGYDAKTYPRTHGLVGDQGRRWGVVDGGLAVCN